MYIKSFQIGSLNINAAMPSALEQDEILSLIGADIIQRAAIMARQGEQVLNRYIFYINQLFC